LALCFNVVSADNDNQIGNSRLLSIKAFEMNKGLHALYEGTLSWVHYKGLVSISLLDASHTAVEKRESGMLCLWCHVYILKCW